jgi:hypothetical protein
MDMLMENIYLQIKAFDRAKIKDVITDAINLCKKLNISLEIEYNTIKFNVFVHSTEEEILSKYHDEFVSKGI